MNIYKFHSFLNIILEKVSKRSKIDILLSDVGCA